MDGFSEPDIPQEPGIIPTDIDVLGGQGRGGNRNAGNIIYRMMISLNKPQYRLCSQDERNILARSIYDSIRQFGSRFLRKEEFFGEWEETPEEDAVDRIKQAMRENRGATDNYQHITAEQLEQSLMDILDDSTVHNSSSSSVLTAAHHMIIIDEEQEQGGIEGPAMGPVSRPGLEEQGMTDEEDWSFDRSTGSTRSALFEPCEINHTLMSF